MSIKKFIKSVVKTLGLDDFKKKNKKKSLQKLLEKLEARQQLTKDTSLKELDNKEKIALTEEREIIALQIKKAKEILKEL